MKLRSPLEVFGEAIRGGEMTPLDVAREVVAKVNGNASRNTYLHFDAAALEREALGLMARHEGGEKPALYGVPVSLKDCFDMAGTVTTFGSKFYAGVNGVAREDSAMAERLREAGCLITGKTHLHPLAYGITGENAEYGDCVQPADAERLTGGSSSGAVASVQEGSALVGIGTDTGGSVRVPAALGGLVGFRASHAIRQRDWPEVWRGARHLAESFDTPGFLLRDVRDAGVVAEALFGIRSKPLQERVRVGFVGAENLERCDADVAASYEAFRHALEEWPRALLADVVIEGWGECSEILAPVQASEAAAHHRGHFAEFEATIAQRLAWGESLSAEEVQALRKKHAAFRDRVDAAFAEVDLLVHPCAPISRMAAGADHSETRARVLRFTSPFSLAGVPVVSAPATLWGGVFGAGVQVAARSGCDATALAFGAAFGEWIAG